jgi:hypothetical protein
LGVDGQSDELQRRLRPCSAPRNHAGSTLRAPDILVRPKVKRFAILDFFPVSQILRAAEGSKEELKFMLREWMKVRG